MTLCYMQDNNRTLMLHRTKKKNDVNKGKWIGVGGKLEKGETPEDGIIREIKEETGYTAEKVDFKGIVVFNYNEQPSEYMHLFTCDKFNGVMHECNEGDLKWIDGEDILDLNLWEGDKVFIDLLKEGAPFFYLTLNYRDDKLLDYRVEFKEEEFAVFEVFVPESHVGEIIKALEKYELIQEGFYKNAYATVEVTGHWTPLEGADPYDGEIGVESIAKESLMKFRVLKAYKELAYYLIKEAHPYEVPVINYY